MASKEPFLYFGGRWKLFRIRVSPLLVNNNQNQNQNLPLEIEYIDFKKTKLAKCGSIPLYMNEKLYLIGCDYDTYDQGVSYNPKSHPVMVEVALDVSWNDADDPTRRVPCPFSPPPFLGALDTWVAKFKNKLFLFHSSDAVDVIGHDTQVLDLGTQKMRPIDSSRLPVRVGRDVPSAKYVWGNHFSVFSRCVRHSFDMEKEEWLDPEEHFYWDLSYKSAASKAGYQYPIPSLKTDHGVAHLGNNLYLTFTNHPEILPGLQLILYQFSSDDLTHISDCRVLHELDHLLDDGYLSDHLHYLGNNVVCMLSFIHDANLQVATFEIKGVQDKARLLGVSRSDGPITPPRPTFIFTMEHCRGELRPSKRNKPNPALVVSPCGTDAQMVPE